MTYKPTGQDAIIHTANGGIFHQRKSDGYINATEFCKANNRIVGEFLRLPSTQDYINFLTTGKSLSIPPVFTKEGKGGGTWIHPKLAIHLGQWISVEMMDLVSDVMISWMSGKSSSPSKNQIKKPNIRRQFTDAFFAVGKGRGEIISATKKITMAIFDMPPEKIKHHLRLGEQDSLRDNVSGYASSLFDIAENITISDLERQRRENKPRIKSSESVRRAVIEVTHLRKVFEENKGETILSEEIRLAMQKITNSTNQLCLF
ncbi:kila protein [Caudoviricetes sp.]|nr:kila protein [Caudoviricetes sp.]